MHVRRNLIVLVTAILCLLVAVGLEHPYFHLNNSTWKSVVFSEDSAVTLAKELAFALIIALIISIGIESESRKSDLENADKLRKDIASDVFKGVFGRWYPPEYIDKVVSTQLTHNVIRKQLQIHFEISLQKRHEDEDRSALPPTKLLLYSKFRSKYICTSARPVRETLQMHIPIAGNQAENISKLLNFKIKRGAETQEPSLQQADVDGGRDYFLDIDLRPKEEFELYFETVLLKEFSDAEIWSTQYPTLQSDITFTVRDGRIQFGLFARTASTPELLYTSLDKSHAEWRIGGPILVNDSITVWWRPEA